MHSYPTMAQRSFHGQYMRYSAPRSSAVPASTTGAIMQYNDLTHRSDNEAIYELVSLGTRYSSSIVAFSQRLQSRTCGVDNLHENIAILQRLLLESNMKIESIKQENRNLKSLLKSSFRLPTPLDRDAMQILEEQERLKNEAKCLKFL